MSHEDSDWEKGCRGVALEGSEETSRTRSAGQREVEGCMEEKEPLETRQYIFGSDIRSERERESERGREREGRAG